jgi:hypothetical protein
MAAKHFDRFRQLHVIASVQPTHAIDDGRWAETLIGHDRASRTYAFRTFLNHGVRLAFGTDWEVAPLDPMLTIYAAVTRATLDGKRPGGWFPEQKLTVPEAVEAYTMGSAYAEFQDKEKGSITPGKLADMVLVSNDLFTIAPAKIREVKVLKTIVGGKIVFGKAHELTTSAQRASGISISAHPAASRPLFLGDGLLWLIFPKPAAPLGEAACCNSRPAPFHTRRHQESPATHLLRPLAAHGREQKSPLIRRRDQPRQPLRI